MSIISVGKNRSQILSVLIEQTWLIRNYYMAFGLFSFEVCNVVFVFRVCRYFILFRGGSRGVTGVATPPVENGQICIT